MKNKDCKMKIANLILGHHPPSSRRHRPGSFSHRRAQSLSQDCAVKLKNNLQFSICNLFAFAHCPLLIAPGSLLFRARADHGRQNGGHGY